MEADSLPHELEPLSTDSGVVDIALDAINAFRRSDYANRSDRIDNARTAIWEALTDSGHMSVVRVEADSLQQLHDTAMQQLVSYYLTPGLDPHQKARAFAEICEEVKTQRLESQDYGLIDSGVICHGREIVTDSPYPSVMSDAVASGYGYDSKAKKGFLRSQRLEVGPDGSVSRVVRSISRSNSDQIGLVDLMGAESAKWGAADLNTMHCSLQAPYVLAGDDGVDWLVDLQRAIDGPNRIYGELTSNAPDYESLEAKSLRREYDLREVYADLAEKEAELDARVAAGEISFAQKARRYNNLATVLLRMVCADHPEYAESCFGSAAARGYRQSAELREAGDSAGANRAFVSAVAVSEAVSFCDAGPGSIGSTGTSSDSESSLLSLFAVSGLTPPWYWQPGYCQAGLCKNGDRKVLVGPCSMCIKCTEADSAGRKID